MLHNASVPVSDLASWTGHIIPLDVASVAYQKVGQAVWMVMPLPPELTTGNVEGMTPPVFWQTLMPL